MDILSSLFWLSLPLLLVLSLIYYITALNVLYLVTSLSQKHKKILVWTLIVWAFINSAGGIIAQTVISNSGKFWWFFDLGYSRNFVIGSFVNLNNYSAFLCLTIPFLVIFLFREYKNENWNMVLLTGLILICILAGVLLSNSRGAYVLSITAIIGSLMWLLKGGSNALKLGIFGVAGVILVLLVLFMPARLSTKLNAKGLDASMRIRLYENADNILKDMPEGLGPGGYRFAGSMYMIDSKKSLNYPSHTENEYLQVLLEWGIFPAILLIAIIIILYKKVLKNIQNKMISERLYKASSVALGIALLHGLYDVAVTVPLYGIVLCVIMGIGLRRGARYDESLDSGWKNNLRWIPAVGIIFGSFFSVYSYSTFGNDIYYFQKPQYSENASIEELVENLHWSPTNWNSWSFLGDELLKTKNVKYLPVAEKCYSLAARYLPNDDKKWHKLFTVRVLLNDLQAARQAYFRYFMLQNINERMKLKPRFLELFPLSDEEFDALIHQELTSEYLTREAIIEFTQRKPYKLEKQKPDQ